MSEIKIELTGETKTETNIVEGVKFTTENLTNENVKIQIGISSIELPKRDLIHLLEGMYIDEDFLSEIEELQATYLSNQNILLEEVDYEVASEEYIPENETK